MFHQIIIASFNIGRRLMGFSTRDNIKIFERYCSVVQNVTRREFRGRRDTLRACYGALSVLVEGANTVLIYRLLASEFTHSLGWNTRGGNTTPAFIQTTTEQWVPTIQSNSMELVSYGWFSKVKYFRVYLKRFYYPSYLLKTLFYLENIPSLP